MDKSTASSPWERAQSLFDKTIELEAKRHKAAQSRTPSDPNLWHQIRENYESIVLQDHAFSEQHTIEFSLWQLHYKRIEEYRSNINAVLASGSSSAAQNAKGPSVTDRVARLKLKFRTFLSEATGFYHEMILKIRAKYGLPLCYFSEDQESQNLGDKDGKKLAQVKKGLVSCHRCLIYLGDLARYKGLYGEGDSKNREYAAASGYYLQAASLLPASGNPHHQLAIIASYSGDEFAATYRYFRSLAVESPFPTARDNLIVAFEKNRQSYAQLLAASKDSSTKPNGKGRGKGKGQDNPSKDANVASVPEKDKVTSANEMLKAFCIRFVRLNGILFTRTSLETFFDVLASTSMSLRELVTSSLMEELVFGKDTSDSALFIVRLVTILIFSTHTPKKGIDSKKETDGQSYAEIVQRVEPARNSLTASFQLLGHVVEQCAQLLDPSSSYFLPGVLVFIEWLACRPDIASSSDPDERLTAVRNSFWNRCVAFFNQILSLGYIDDVEEETCFSNMSMYDERETENRLALWEDYELRGFLPLLPAQTILDFSRKHSFGTEGPKEKKARIKRILAAGKALTSVIKVDQSCVYFDSKKKKFLVGVKPLGDLLDSHSSPPKADNALQDNQAMMNHKTLVLQRDQQIYLGEEEDDEEEEIVFKPLVTEKKNGACHQTYVPNGGSKNPDQVPNGGFRNPDQVATMGDLKALTISDEAFHGNMLLQPRGNAAVQVPASVGSNLLGHLLPSMQSQGVQLQQPQTQAVHPQQAQSLASARVQPQQSQVSQLQPHQSQVSQLQPLQSRTVHFQQTQGQISHVSRVQPHSTSLSGSNWLPTEAARSLSGFAQMGNGPVMRNGMQGNPGFSYYPAHSLPIHQSFNVNGMGGMPYSQTRTPEAGLPSMSNTVSSSGVIADGLGVQSSVARKTPIGRASRHLGPPPGFNSVPSKLVKEPAPGPDMSGNNPQVDDYSWLDGYQGQSSRGTGFNSSLNYASSEKPEHMGTGNGLSRPANFPFPGKQAPSSQIQEEFPYVQHPQRDNNDQSAQLPDQSQGQPSWPSRRFV
ncbi:nonsense-mediated mRNA decay factor SMG7 isoform X2 [Raphanus sativus]|uniref:Nonsense-mediated mRNA decay factor SMG7 isoform X2 n=1 Tax=Raphanus sativus TaxID=3726 RepID=A0A9W3D3J1_RAPSA|nr:nonsense-mediated mRNA decay factor SMG7 isoform X2 [Raphanus sativus]